MSSAQTALNGICPYFTMFPLDFPLNILKRRAQAGDVVLDPFCGRGTTNFAARLLGLYSVGVDSSSVAVAITAAKLVSPHPDQIVAEARHVLDKEIVCTIPEGEFWQWAFHPTVLEALCRLREAFLEDCSSDARIALRGIILGALHGPKQKTFPSYFSNQCPRTYAPKPAYATRFWQERRLMPDSLDVLAIIERRARRYYKVSLDTTGMVQLADSRLLDVFNFQNLKANWIITSPPYYGMHSYIPDQWLRNWFLGGSDKVDYSSKKQLRHGSAQSFLSDLSLVWRNIRDIASDDAQLVVRFGGIANKSINPLELIKNSLETSDFAIVKIDDAGNARTGRRQADAFLRTKSNPMFEYDIWAIPN